ncbi:MAG: four helix bundle protein [Cyclobacteriaceae bacterium]|nr:four helix bundle protein [Cyclobacteriaceae bacterium]MDX5467393.1 four helix bundle protein [Cyclobacteriaceae bacterium]
MNIFEITKGFSVEEKYSLTDQIRRSSRSICANIAESYRKRNYPNQFISKLSDADMENSETQVWLDFALSCKYLEESIHSNLSSEISEIGRILNFMILNPEKFGSNSKPKL